MILELIPSLINFLLLIITGLTIRYASRSLHMEYSSQVIVSNYSKSFSANRYYQHQWEVTIKNIGKGYIVKAFILLSVKRKGIMPYKLYYLSKPIVELLPTEERKLLLQLGDDEIGKGNFENAKVEVIYQDSLGNIYLVTPRRKGWNTHLETFDILPKRMNKYRVLYWIYILKLKISAMQGNTSPGRLNKEMEKKRKEYEPIMKAIEKKKFKNENNLSTKNKKNQ